MSTPSLLLNLVRRAANDRANGNRAKRAAGGLLTLLPGRQRWWGARLPGQRRRGWLSRPTRTVGATGRSLWGSTPPAWCCPARSPTGAPAAMGPAAPAAPARASARRPARDEPRADGEASGHAEGGEEG